MTVSPRAAARPLLPNGDGNDYSTDSGSHRSSSSSLADPVPERERVVHEAVMVPTQRDKLSFVLIVAGIVLFLPLTWILVLTANPFALGYFAPHAPLNALAISALALGIAAVQPPTPGRALRETRLATHQWILAGLAVPAMVIGTCFMFYNKAVHNAEHITTWHGTFGCLTLLWMLGQACVGALSVWRGGKAFGGGMKAKAVYKYHRVSGYLLLALALFTAFLGGMYSTWAVGRGATYVPLRVAAFGVGIPLILGGVLVNMHTSKMRFF